MKAIVHIVTLCLLISVTAFSKIRNGYECKFEQNRICLLNLQSRLKSDLSLALDERHAIRTDIRKLEDFLAYHELTTKTLLQLQLVSPGIYYELDNLEDLNGRETDVYVRLISRDNAITSLRGVSFIRQSARDENASTSIFGENSVSVDVWISDNALLLLSHELGHVKYIVPNLAVYSAFYRKRYATESINLSYLGHCPDDKSGIHADKFVRQFLKDRRVYASVLKKKPERITLVLGQIRDSMKNGKPGESSTTVALNSSD